MANGRPGDHPLTDFRRHDLHPFPADIEALLHEIEAAGSRAGRDPLGRNWPFSPREWDWEKGQGLEEGRPLLRHLLSMIKDGRGDEILIDPETQEPLSASPPGST